MNLERVSDCNINLILNTYIRNILYILQLLILYFIFKFCLPIKTCLFLHINILMLLFRINME